MTAPRQRGQVLVLVALLAAVLVGIVGLALDSGEVAAEQSLVQAAADGAAMAAAYEVTQGTTQAAATQYAGAAVQADGFASSGLSLAYLNSSGGTVAAPGTAGVTTVQATLLENRATFFLGALGIRTVRITATARASTGTTSAACALCVLPGTGVTYHQLQSSTVTVTGAPLVINSTSAGNLTLDKKATLSAPSILLGSLSQSVASGASVSPAPVVGTTTDPYLGIATPILAGAPIDVSHASGTTALAAGVYHNIAITGGSLTLAGVYVVTGQLTMTGGALLAVGATIYLGCPAYPTACAAAGAAGGLIATSGGSIVMTAPTTGCEAGLALFADRKNTSAMSFVNTAVNISGTVYAPDQALTIDNPSSAQTFNSQILVAGMNVNSGTTVSDSYTSSANLAGAHCVALAP